MHNKELQYISKMQVLIKVPSNNSAAACNECKEGCNFATRVTHASDTETSIRRLFYVRAGK